MTILSASYRLTPEACHKHLVASGSTINEFQSVEFDLAQMTPEQRETIVTALGMPDRQGKISASINAYAPKASGYRADSVSFQIEGSPVHLEAAPTLDEVFEHVARMTREKAEAEMQRESAIAAKQAQLKAESEARTEEIRRNIAEANRDEQAKETAEAARRTAVIAPRLAWARENGSDRLLRALEAGHTCTRLYWVERAAAEYPGYVVDIEKSRETKERACPSVEALDERDAILAAHPGVMAAIVWLTTPARDHKLAEDEYEEFDECEAVEVDDPDYSYMLVKII